MTAYVGRSALIKENSERFSIGLLAISGCEVVGAFVRRETVEAASDYIPQALESALCGGSEQRFKLAKAFPIGSKLKL